MGKIVAGMLFLVMGAVAVQFYSGRQSLFDDRPAANLSVPISPPKPAPSVVAPLVKIDAEPAPVRSSDLPVYGPIVSPILQSRLGFEEKGRLAEIKVSEGEVIKKGAEIMRLDTTQVDATISTKEAELALAQTRAENDAPIKKAKDTLYTATGEFEAAKRLVASNAMSRQEYQRTYLAYQLAQSDVQTAEMTMKMAKLDVERLSSELKEAKLARERHILLAPFDCQVIRVFRDRSEYIKEGPVVQVAQLERMKIEGAVQEEAIGLEELTVGMPVEIAMSGTDRKHAGKLVFVDNVVIAGERRIIAEVDNAVLDIEGESRWAISPGASVSAVVKTGPSAAK